VVLVQDLELAAVVALVALEPAPLYLLLLELNIRLLLVVAELVE
jgi:hypothetical protein